MKIKILPTGQLMIDGIRKSCPFDNYPNSAATCNNHCALFNIAKDDRQPMAYYDRAGNRYEQEIIATSAGHMVVVSLCHKTYTVDAEDFINEFKVKDAYE